MVGRTLSDTQPRADGWSRPLISVVVPHFNQPDQLRRCLASLAAQTLGCERFEVIVVDNGSQVPPGPVVADLANARLEAEPARGPGPARNKGVALARGDILAFIDADCTADPRWLEEIARFYEGAPEGTVIGGDVRIAMTDPAHPTMLEAYEAVFAYRQREYIERMGFSGTGNLAMRPADFAAVGPFAGIDVAEDRDWGRRAIAAGLRIVYVPQMVVFHPARTSLGELTAKWRRHTEHDLAEWRKEGKGTLAWIARAVAVTLSPLVHWVRPATSNRISGLAPRLAAIWVLARVRIWRGGQMIAALMDVGGVPGADSWNVLNKSRDG